MPVIEEVEEGGMPAEGSQHTTVQMGAAARLQAFAEDGGLAAAREEGNTEEAAGSPADPAASGVRAEDAGDGAETRAEGDGEGDGEKEKEKELTEEEKIEQEAMLERARLLKAEGNALFGSYEYDAAIRKYSEAIEAAPNGHKEQAVFFNNRATCYFKQVRRHRKEGDALPCRAFALGTAIRRPDMTHTGELQPRDCRLYCGLANRPGLLKMPPAPRPGQRCTSVLRVGATVCYICPLTFLVASWHRH